MLLKTVERFFPSRTWHSEECDGENSIRGKMGSSLLADADWDHIASGVRGPGQIDHRRHDATPALGATGLFASGCRLAF
jgi:hypothetical protein